MCRGDLRALVPFYLWAPALSLSPRGAPSSQPLGDTWGTAQGVHSAGGCTDSWGGGSPGSGELHSNGPAGPRGSPWGAQPRACSWPGRKRSAISSVKATGRVGATRPAVSARRQQTPASSPAGGTFRPWERGRGGEALAVQKGSVLSSLAPRLPSCHRSPLFPSSPGNGCPTSRAPDLDWCRARLLLSISVPCLPPEPRPTSTPDRRQWQPRAVGGGGCRAVGLAPQESG